ncbi:MULTISPECIES: H-NS family nucleoid-associated regulatory protein [unclassified Paraburkholderia]|uniref:H-NS family nucleoid-associated regulatory protein n=1 Tax=unclassified Paraburkholderia TaxID=2615204 RepID=UPI0038B6F1C1
MATPAPASKGKAAGNYVRGPQPALYRDPKSGATWSGRGRPPTWIAKAKDRSKFLIAGGAESTVAATASAVSKAKAVGKKTASKSGGATAGKGQPKGPQPVKYRDPKSGATWSGRGSAPGWLAGAKDRSRFLIDGAAAVASEAGAVSKASKPKAAGKSGAAAKKAAAKKVGAKEAAATKSPTVKKVVAKKAAAPSVQRPVAKKMAGKKAVAVKTVTAKADTTATPEASVEVGA